MGWNGRRCRCAMRRPSVHRLRTSGNRLGSDALSGPVLILRVRVLLHPSLLWSQQVGVSQERNSDEERNEPDQIGRIAAVDRLNEDHHANADSDRD